MCPDNLKNHENPEFAVSGFEPEISCIMEDLKNLPNILVSDVCLKRSVNVLDRCILTDNIKEK
jgi:hypothetical protein